MNNEASSDDEEEHNNSTRYWHQATDAWFKKFKINIMASRLSNLRFSPQNDPVAFKRSKLPMSSSDKTPLLDMQDFCLPDVVVWVPELLYPELYPRGLPPCKFHGTAECVGSEGWARSPRHCYDLQVQDKRKEKPKTLHFSGP